MQAREAKALHVPWQIALQEVARWPCTMRSTTASWMQGGPLTVSGSSHADEISEALKLVRGCQREVDLRILLRHSGGEVWRVLEGL